MTRVSEILSNRMKELRLSAEQVADYCGVNKATVYRWLNGEVDNMRRTSLSRHSRTDDRSRNSNQHVDVFFDLTSQSLAKPHKASQKKGSEARSDRFLYKSLYATAGCPYLIQCLKDVGIGLLVELHRNLPDVLFLILE